MEPQPKLSAVAESPESTDVYARALSRVQHEFAKVTDALIQAVFQNSREPSPALEARIQALEAKRDELHERLQQLEDRSRPSRYGR